MPKAKLIHIGTFDKPVGLKGEIKIKTYISKLESFTHYGPLFSDENLETWDLKLIKVIKNKIVVRLTNVTTRNEAELLKGKKIFVERKNFPKIKKNEFYDTDLINFRVVTINKKDIGIVKNIENFGAGDLIDIKLQNGNECLVPMNKENIVSIDIINNKIIIDPIKGIIN